VDATGGIELRRRWDGEGEGEQRGGRWERREEEGLTGADRGGRREHGGGRKEGAPLVGEVHEGTGVGIGMASGRGAEVDGIYSGRPGWRLAAGLGWAGPVVSGKHVYNLSSGLNGIMINYPIKFELRLGFEFQYPQKPYEYQALGYTSLGLGFLDFKLQKILCPD
jgi:hypothetical protein